MLFFWIKWLLPICTAHDLSTLHTAIRTHSTLHGSLASPRKIIQCRKQSLAIMVSKIVLLFFFGQILLAILFFYLLPISSAIEYQKSSGKIEKSSKPIINLKQGELLFSILKCWRENLFCGVFSWVKRVKKSTIQVFKSKSQYRT